MNVSSVEKSLEHCAKATVCIVAINAKMPTRACESISAARPATGVFALFCPECLGGPALGCAPVNLRQRRKDSPMHQAIIARVTVKNSAGDF